MVVRKQVREQEPKYIFFIKKVHTKKNASYKFFLSFKITNPNGAFIPHHISL